MTHATDTTADQAAATIAPRTRRIVAYLLFLHVVCLAVGFAAPYLQLADKLRHRVPGLKSYLQLFGFEPFVMSRVTGGAGRSDASDYAIEFDVSQADGTTKTERPTGYSNIDFGTAHRYRRLAAAAAEFAASGDDDLASLLPQAIGRRLMMERGCRGLTLRIVRRGADDDEPIYEGRVFVNADGETELLRVRPPAETAPPLGRPIVPPDREQQP